MGTEPFGKPGATPPQTRLLEVLNAIVALVARGCAPCPGCAAWIASRPALHLADCPGEQAIREIAAIIASHGRPHAQPASTRAPPLPPVGSDAATDHATPGSRRR